MLNEFEETMNQLDSMIKQFELNLGKSHSVSPFDEIRQKYGHIQPTKEPKVEEVKEEKKDNKKKKEKNEEKKAAKPAKEPEVTLSPELEWFNNCDLRVGKIVACEVCEGSDKLYIEKIDLGEGTLREIGSGVQQYVSLEEMLRPDGFCVVFANLKPRKLAHIMSQGMVMFASNEDHTVLEMIRPPAGSKVGERVSLQGNPIGSGFSQEPLKDLNPKKKYMENLLTLTKSNNNCQACYNEIPMVTSGGIITVKSLKNSKIA